MALFPVATLIFGTTLWLGLYLVNRDLHCPGLCSAGIGLFACALAWAGLALGDAAPTATFAAIVVRWFLLCSFLPPVFWTSTLILLVPEDLPLHENLRKIWLYALLPFTLASYILIASSNLLVAETTNMPANWQSALILALLFFLPSFMVLCLIGPKSLPARSKKAKTLSIAQLFLLTLSASILFFSSNELVRIGIFLLVDFDLLFQGFTLAALDAIEQGEALIPDMFRSYDYSFFTALFFAGQVVLVMIFATGPTFPMRLLLLALMLTSIAAQIFSNQVGGLVDKVALSHFPQLRQVRAELRTTANTLPRVNPELDLQALDEVEFVRLTRRALSNFGDLSRLAVNPLTHLPIIQARLAQRSVKDDALGRAVELKAVLLESITRLKPPCQDNFGTSTEWRHYNALYFPYVIGLKPYSRRFQHVYADETHQKALVWFRNTVPERTLHNWQTAATKLIAEDLRR
jgi:hypothetical protein